MMPTLPAALLLALAAAGLPLADTTAARGEDGAPVYNGRANQLEVKVPRLAGAGVEVVPIPGSEYPLPAARPANGVLSSLGSPRLRHWREALADYLEREAVLDGRVGGD